MSNDGLKRTTANKVFNRYERTKVRDIALVQGDAGVCMVVQFERPVCVDGQEFAFPLSSGQLNRLFKMATGITAEEILDTVESGLILPPGVGRA
jgi:hypothetical protein